MTNLGNGDKYLWDEFMLWQNSRQNQQIIHGQQVNTAVQLEILNMLRGNQGLPPVVLPPPPPEDPTLGNFFASLFAAGIVGIVVTVLVGGAFAFAGHVLRLAPEDSSEFSNSWWGDGTPLFIAFGVGAVVALLSAVSFFREFQKEEGP